MKKNNIVHQIYISSSPSSYTPPNSESIDLFFPNFDRILWTEKNIKKIMEQNGDDKIKRAFDKIKPFAFKADIARYYLIYHYGGWYTDLNNFFAKEPPDTDDIDMVVFRDASMGEIGTWAVQNSIFFSKIGNPILKWALNKAIDNIFSEYYGPHPLCATSPVLFGAAMANDYALMHQKSIIGDFHVKKYNPRGFYLQEDLFASYKPNMEEIRDIPVEGGNEYERMWYGRDMYN